MNFLRVCVVLLALGCTSVFAQTPEPPEIAAKAYLLVDITAGQVLAQRQADAPVEPASLTKLMTAYLVFDALRTKKISLQQTFSVSEAAWKMPG
jgi:D-alanyl-D-alanine carboxypeptidase (penicillin-binding protein 5/6)